jgi:nucleoid-associated protein YgaU
VSIVLIGLSIGACAPATDQSDGPGPPVTSAGSVARVYVVQKDDLGFWSIAEKIYGDGKHWRLIAEANPDVDVEKLSAGDRLKIPKLPKGKRE